MHTGSKFIKFPLFGVKEFTCSVKNDRAIRGPSMDNDSPNIPAIRQPTESADESEYSVASVKKTPRIRSTDYCQWDKYDAGIYTLYIYK